MVKGSKKGNNYIIEGNTVKMELKRNNGNESFWTTFDLEDLGKVINFPNTWHATFNKANQEWYVVSDYYTDDENGNRIRQSQQVLLHMFIMDSEGTRKIHVDHIDHNPMNNTKENLRVTDSSKNLRNRGGKNSNNSTGYRNVAYIKYYKSYVYAVQLMVNGKNTTLGRFTDVDEAGAFAEKMRQKYYGEFAGES